MSYDPDLKFFVFCFGQVKDEPLLSLFIESIACFSNARSHQMAHLHVFCVHVCSDVIFLTNEVWQSIFTSPFSLPAYCLTRVVPLLIQFNKRNFMATCGWITLSLESYNLWFNLEPVFHLSELPRDTLDDSMNLKRFSSSECLSVVGRRFFILM